MGSSVQSFLSTYSRLSQSIELWYNQIAASAILPWIKAKAYYQMFRHPGPLALDNSIILALQSQSESLAVAKYQNNISRHENFHPAPIF